VPIIIRQLTQTGWRDLGAPPPSPTQTMLVGATCYHPPLSAKNSWTQILEPQVGPLTIRRSFESEATGVPTSWETSEASIDIGKRASAHSIRPPVAEFNNGAYDTKLRNFLRSIPDDGYPKFLIGWHEADSKVRRGNYTRVQFINAFKRFADIVHDEGVPNTYTAVCYTDWLFNDPNKAAGQPEQYWIDGGYIDVWTMDGYQYSGPELFGKAVQFCRERNVPWAVAETGKTDNPADPSIKAQWILDMADYCASQGSGGWPSAVFMCWFDSAVGFDESEAHLAYTPTSSPASIAAANTVCQTYYRDPKSVILGG